MTYGYFYNTCGCSSWEDIHLFFSSGCEQSKTCISAKVVLQQCPPVMHKPPLFMLIYCKSDPVQKKRIHIILCKTAYKGDVTVTFRPSLHMPDWWALVLDLLLTPSAPMHMRDGKPELVERCSRRSSSRPVLLRVLVLPFLYSKDPRDQSAEEKSGGIPHLVQRTHTHKTEVKDNTKQERRVCAVVSVFDIKRE